jgi:hypothetical protein
MHPWKIYEVGSAIPAAPSLYVLFTALLGLEKTMEIIVTIGTGTSDLS